MKNKNIYISLSLFILWLIFSLIAGLRTPGFDRDSLTYIDLINRSLEDIWFQEPTFIFLVYVNRLLFDGTYQTFFMFYALLGVGFKLYAINKLDEGKILALVIYFLLYYALHDLTQIRVGVASGLFLLSLFYLDTDKKKAFLLQSAAILFHYSAVVGIVTLFFSTRKINKLFWILAVVIAVILSKWITQSLVLNIANILPAFVSVKIINYINILNENGIFMDFNQYNFYYLGCVALFFAGIFIAKENDKNALFLISIKILASMIISYYILAPVPIIAGRVSEFFGIVMIIYLPLLASLFYPKKLMVLLILIFISIHAIRLNIDILNF